MALVTLEQLRTSPEAHAAGVTEKEDDLIQAALDDAHMEITARLGYPIEDDRTEVTVPGSGTPLLVVPARVATATTVAVNTNETEYYEVSGGGFHLVSTAGYWPRFYDVVITGTFGYEASDPQWSLAARAVKLLAVHRLQTTDYADRFPVPAGAYVSGFSSENVSFSYFTPDSVSGVSDVDRLVALIGPLNVLA